ncbi:MAG: outer membrane lipoprotein carrier protein LolA [Acidobacteria bacterium]|nr:outer membrane lipoprotein carrier protein LolA [Acidobacteriota bacterium]
MRTRSESQRRPIVPGARICCALLLIGAAWSGPGAAPSGTGDAAKHALRLQASLESIRGLVASFTQTLESPGLPRPQTETGTVFLLRPGKMRWEYDEPPGKLAIADGSRVYLYLPEDRQVVVAPLHLDDAGQGMSLLLRDRIDLSREFSIGWGTAAQTAGSRPLLLRPRSPGADYDYLLVESESDGLIRALTIVDPLGGRVSYRFDRVRLVGSLPESLFHFEAPPDVKIREIAP